MCNIICNTNICNITIYSIPLPPCPPLVIICNTNICNIKIHQFIPDSHLPPSLSLLHLLRTRYSYTIYSFQFLMLQCKQVKSVTWTACKRALETYSFLFFALYFKGLNDGLAIQCYCFQCLCVDVLIVLCRLLLLVYCLLSTGLLFAS